MALMICHFFRGRRAPVQFVARRATSRPAGPRAGPFVLKLDTVRGCHVRFPNRSRERAGGNPVAKRTAGGPMAKVMVVDDAYSDLALMESILKGAGHQVVSLIDGEQIEDRLDAERPDLLLLDIVMPK